MLPEQGGQQSKRRVQLSWPSPIHKFSPQDGEQVVPVRAHSVEPSELPCQSSSRSLSIR